MSVTHLWMARWEQSDAPAITFAGEVLSYGDLALRIRRAATWIRERGLEPGAVLALQMERSTTFLELHLAALALGVVTLPLNPRSTPEESAHMLRDSGAAEGIPAQIPVDTIAAEIAGCAPHPLDRVPDLEGIGVLCYTSGTTGRPKGARIRQRNLLATVSALHEAWRWSPQDVLVHALPLFHIHGLFVAQHAALMAGAHAVWLPTFSVEAAWRAIHAHGGTVFMGVPTFYNRMVQSPVEPAQLDTMRLFTSGSAPLSARTWRRFRDRFGHEILERYGMTEVGIVLSNPYEGPRVPGSVGLPLPDIEARLDDAGEIWLRGPSVFAGYHERPEATAAALQDGWMRTGDFATRDEEGFYRLLGRRTDLILTGGFNVYPGEVESVLREHPAVRQLAAFGVPDDDLGEVVHVAIVGDVEPQEALTWCRQRLSAYKCPKRIWIRGALPRNAMGKVRRSQLTCAYGLGERWPADTRAAIADLLQQDEGGRRIAALDFDDTCIRGDVGLALLDRFDALSSRDLVAEYEADCARDTRTGYANLTSTLLAGRTPDEVRRETREALTEALADGRITWVDEIRRLIQTLQTQDWEVWIVTASPEVVVQVAAAHYDIPHAQVIGMRCALESGRYTPQVLEPITYRQGKLDALHRRCGAGPQLAMGDSLSDASLLHAAQVGILVDRGDPALRDHAHEVGWHIVEGW